MKNYWIVAQADAVEAQPSQAGEVIEAQDIDTQESFESESGLPVDPNAAVNQQPKGFLDSPLMWMLPVFIIVWLFMMRGPKKQRRKQQQMMKDLAKNDRIQTVGGIIATVIAVNEDSITVKIDESNNTKMDIVPNSVSRVLERK